MLSKFALPEICGIISDYAFKRTRKKDVFRLGNYEDCVKILKEVNKLKISKEQKQRIYNCILLLACAGGFTKIIDLVDASSDNEILGVQFKLDGKNFFSEDAPYEITLDTTSLSNSEHFLTATLRDSVGNMTTSSQVNFIGRGLVNFRVADAKANAAIDGVCRGPG